MYLAPLNYYRYFKKVFSEPSISKRFLEDFFEIEIVSIELMSTGHKVTDASSAVEFDFRCKLSSGEYVIIDMQQWYKTDIVKRFYMYHSMNTVLQLEKIPDKTIDLAEDKQREIKDYNQLEPVYTLIWWVDHNLGFEEDYVSYTIEPETLVSFIRNKNLWKAEQVLRLLEERARLLKTIDDNKTKKLDFLQQNKLIYVFQPNVVKNKRYSKYLPWFELAQKSCDKLNDREWFTGYQQDEIFRELIRRISTESFEAADWEYIENYERFRVQVKLFEMSFVEEGIEIGKEILKKQRMDEKARQMAKMMKDNNEPVEKIIAYTGLTAEAIENL
jgi:hypothetical protein